MMNILTDQLPVLIAGVRTPFLDSAGAYSSLMSYELGAVAIKALMEQVTLMPQQVEMVIMGTVLHEVNTTNVAREAMLAAGMPSSVPAYTVSMAGISPSVGVMNLCSEIALGRMQFGIASGTENFSDIPIRLSQKIRRTFMKVRQSRKAKDRLKLLTQLSLKDLTFDLPRSEDYTTGLTMGSACENMARKFSGSRAESDAFAAASHARAIAAQQAGYFQEQIVPVSVKGQTISKDNSLRADATEASLAKLRPVFDKTNGIITAGNTSRFTDGAGALLLGALGSAREQSLQIQAIFRDYLLAGVPSLQEEMLLGPAVTVPRLLARNNLKFEDIGVWEIHEAFATQVLINRHCMASRQFIEERFGTDVPCGEIPLDKLNVWGGSLSLGNPFAATGVRLIQTAAQRLKLENQRYAIVSTCAGGGLGAALLLENPAFS